MMGTLVVKRLREERLKPILLLVTHKKADRPCLKFSLKPNICLQQVSRSPISKSTLSQSQTLTFQKKILFLFASMKSH